MLRKTLAALLAILLLCLQHEMQVHAFSHWELRQAKDAQIASASIDYGCVTCGILAGACAAPSPRFDVSLAQEPKSASPRIAAASHRPDRLSFYRSRAPPSLA